MIRVGLPAPALLRLRIRAQLAVAGFNRQASELRQTVNRGTAAVKSIVSIPFRLTRSENSPPPDVALNQFEERYQNLIDLLCWSAKDGVKMEGIERYHRLKAWFAENYDSVRPKVVRYLCDVDDCAFTNPMNSANDRDAFESLFLRDDLGELINSEDVISCIQRTRSALDSYRESLAPMSN